MTAGFTADLTAGFTAGPTIGLIVGGTASGYNLRPQRFQMVLPLHLGAIPLLKQFCLLLLCLSAGTLAASGDRPNVLFIMSDDHAAHAISAYESRLSEIAPTPNIDRLAREGALLSNVFCTNSICSPSRACVITGQYNHTNGAFDLAGSVEPADQMLPRAMERAGYQTAMIGKWHLKTVPSAFDYYYVLPGQGRYHDPVFLTGAGGGEQRTVETRGHVTDRITDESIRWLSEQWTGNEPFFLMHHFKAPHDYFDNAPRYESYLAGQDIPAPKTLFERSPKFGSMATRGHDDELFRHVGTSIGARNPRRSYLGDLPKLYPDEFPPNFDPDDYDDAENKRMAYNAYLRKYLRCIKGIDDNLGRLFKQLETMGQLDNTLIVYTSDQGFMLGEHDYQDKRWMYEESMRMPFLVRHPSTIAAGTRSDAIIENVDFAATLIEFAGGQPPASNQGRSFLSILKSGNEPDDWKTAAYYRYWMHMAHHDNPAHVGMRTKTHKLIYYYGCNYDGGYQTPPGWELYDMVNDPAETVNLVDDPSSADLLATLKAQLEALRRDVGDDGTHHPKAEAMVDEFWDFDKADRQRAIEISHQYRSRREQELDAGKRSPKTWVGDGN